jgi:predicted metal-dependent hydrolase
MDESSPRVEVRRSARRRRTVSAFREQDTIVVVVPERMSRAEERRHVDALVTRLLAREARTRAPREETELLRRAAELSRRYLAEPLGETPLPVAVTWTATQRRRWGSCTPANRTIRLSDRLQPMPAWVTDYVLLHELIHLVEANHSPRFARLLAAYPRAERARGYLEGFADSARLPGAPPDDDPDDLDLDGDVVDGPGPDPAVP